jgi:hypothetical protein
MTELVTTSLGVWPVFLLEFLKIEKRLIERRNVPITLTLIVTSTPSDSSNVVFKIPALAMTTSSLSSDEHFAAKDLIEL